MFNTMKHTFIILTLAALLVAPTAHAVYPPSDAAGATNAMPIQAHADQVQVMPISAEDGSAPSTGAGHTPGNTEKSDEMPSIQKARALDAALKENRAHTVEAVKNQREHMQTAVENVKARVQEAHEVHADQIEAIKPEAHERLSEIPRWIIGVCSDTATCEERKAVLKAKCEELSAAATDTAQQEGCSYIDKITCEDIEEDIEQQCTYIAEKKEEVKDRLEEVRAKVEEKRGEIKEDWEERKEELKENAKDRIDAYIARLIDRINAAIDRLSKLAERIEERIAILESEGVDTSDAQASVDAAREHLEAAEEYLTDVSTLTADALASDTPRESISIVKEAIRAAAEEVREARADLKEAIRHLKAHTSGDTE
jgi:chromosome segregation ATPase